MKSIQYIHPPSESHWLRLIITVMSTLSLRKEQIHVSTLFIDHFQVDKRKNLVSSYTRIVWAETCSCSLCNKLYTYLYHHIVVLDKYVHSNLVPLIQF